MENVALSEATCAIQALHSKKRFRSDMSIQKQFSGDRARDTTKQSELVILREALKSERESLHKLRIELEEERGASMTAADEAMAMITRLQEEKAAVLVEARRFKLAAEERETHNQEAIGILKDALLTKEDDLMALQDLIGAYRETLLRLETEQGEFLENTGSGDQLLLLEGPSSTLSCMNLNQATMFCGQNEGVYTGSGHPVTDNKQEETECQDELFGSHGSQVFRHYDERSYEGLTEGDFWTGGTMVKQGHSGYEDAYCEQLMFQRDMHSENYKPEPEDLKHSQEQAFDDVSVSIFARVKRLEERFEHLRQSQDLEYLRLNVDCQSDGMISDNLKSQKRAETNCEEAAPKVLHNRKLRYFMEPGGLPEDDFANGGHGEPEEVLKCLSSERVRLDIRNQGQELGCLDYHGGPGFGSDWRPNKSNVLRVHDKQSTSLSQHSDDESEGVHDVYEVQSEVKQSSVHSIAKDYLEDNITGQQKFETGNMDALIIGTLQEVEKGSVEVGLAAPSNYAQAEVCTTEVSKLSLSVSPPELKDVHLNVTEEDVHQLKIRLQALEGERVFMKEAIESLRKENKELKILQDLAQQLRELNMDVRRTEVTGPHGEPSLFSFLKGVLSFTGFHSRGSFEGNRCILHSCSFSNNQRQDGLRHVLDKGCESPKSVCVIRERKVILGRT